MTARSSKDWDVVVGDGSKPLPNEQALPFPDPLVQIIAEAMSDAVWERARNASHRPEMVNLWRLDANARYNLAEAVAERVRPMIR